MEEIELSNEEYAAFCSMVEETDGIVELPDAAIAGKLSMASSYETIHVTDDEDVVRVSPLREGKFLVHKGKTAWYVPEGVVESNAYFPEVDDVLLDENQPDLDYQYVFDENTPFPVETLPAKRSPNPVSRFDDDPVTVTHLTLTNGLGVPYEWQGKTDDGESFYLRQRSGTIQARVGGEYGLDGTTIFHAFIGSQFPGTKLTKKEIIRIVDSMDYISIGTDLPEVPDEELDSVFAAHMEVYDSVQSFDDDIIDE